LEKWNCTADSDDGLVIEGEWRQDLALLPVPRVYMSRLLSALGSGASTGGMEASEEPDGPKGGGRPWRWLIWVKNNVNL
jgi:hypothetical protein